MGYTTGRTRLGMIAIAKLEEINMLENVKISSDIIAIMEDIDNDTVRGTNGSSLSASSNLDTLRPLFARQRIHDRTRGRDTVHRMIHRSGKVRDTGILGVFGHWLPGVER